MFRWGGAARGSRYDIERPEWRRGGSSAAIVPAGTSGDISVFASGSTILVIDINGYLGP